jgi:DNA modification methylase
MKVLNQKQGDNWIVYHGDTAEVINGIPSNSIDFSVFSPPFASLYTYSNSERDMGNCRNHKEFWDHFAFLCPELYRILTGGRLVSIHCMNLPKSKERDGVIGLYDFRGDVIRSMESAGFVYHSEVVIWKDPVTAMQRTKAIGLLYKQLRKDSAMSRQGIPDYVVTFRKPDNNLKPVTKTHESFPVDRWQHYASPVWMDIDPGDTLTRTEVRENDDERHICALQLQVIRRCIELWTNPGDVVFSPFAGIGSEGVCALEMRRKFVGVELKQSYFDQAVLNVAAVESNGIQADLFQAVS